MEIIKRGTPPSEKVFQGECYACGTIVKFTRAEAAISPDHREGPNYYITCPICKTCRILGYD